MGHCLLGATALLAAGLLASIPARACGFGEAPGDCGQTMESEARYMLLRVTAAVKADAPTALQRFTKGEGGFRTQDTYVFCVGPDGVMSAHPSPLLLGHDVRDLHDQTGNYFIATMLKTAESGKVSEIKYLFPRPGSNVAVPKTTYYTRASDQVCGVGVYDGDDGPAPAPTLSPHERLVQARERLNAGMPASLRGDWAAYQQLLDEQAAAQQVAIDKAREQVQAAATVLASR